MFILFLVPTFYPLLIISQRTIRCHRSFIHFSDFALMAEDFYRSSKQITAVAHANSRVISTPVVFPALSDRPQPATTNATHARRLTVEISFQLTVVFTLKLMLWFHHVLHVFSVHAYFHIYPVQPRSGKVGILWKILIQLILLWIITLQTIWTKYILCFVSSRAALWCSG